MLNLIELKALLEQIGTTLGIIFQEANVAGITRVFRARLYGLAVRGMTGEGSILGDVRRLVQTAVEDAYYAGLAESGIGEEDVGPEEKRKANELVATQLAYVTDFCKAVRESRDDRALQRNILDNRIDIWARSIEAAGEVGRADGAANEMVTWKWGPTEEHCKDCKQLNGQKHRRKWFADRGFWPRRPGASMECGGYNCQCELIAVGRKNG